MEKKNKNLWDHYAHSPSRLFKILQGREIPQAGIFRGQKAKFYDLSSARPVSKNWRMPKACSRFVPHLRSRASAIIAKKYKILAALAIGSWAVAIAIAPKIDNFSLTKNLASFASLGHHTYQLSITEEIKKIELKQFVINGAVLEEADVLIQGTPAGKLYIENLVIDGLSARKFEIKNSDIINFSAEKVRADGVSFKQTPKEVSVFDLISRSTLPSVHEKNYSVDRVVISTEDEPGYIEWLILEDFQIKDGVTLENLVINNLILKNILVGSGDGLEVKDFLLEDVSIKNETGLDIQEELINVK